MKKWQIVLKGFLSPLPNPEIVLQKYWSAPFRHLSGNQIKLIIEMVIAEAKISRGFGLFIRPDDLDKEIIFWLTYVNLLGPHAIRHSNYNALWRETYDAQMKSFSDAIDYYHHLIANSKPRVTSSENAYECHLRSLQTTILLTIYNDHFPL